jgi:hypothetical protein
MPHRAEEKRMLKEELRYVLKWTIFVVVIVLPLYLYLHFIAKLDRLPKDLEPSKTAPAAKSSTEG